MRIVFMGTPDFAQICLRALVEAGLDVVAAVTQPDKPRGRGYQMIPPPVKVFAQEQGIAVYQPQTLRDGAFSETLKQLDPDVIVVAAYGKILPSYIIDYPRLGCINAHGSLLPKYRGAAPIQRAIMDGEAETGITIMYMNQGLDTGDMLLWEKTPIADTDDFASMHDRLAQMAGGLLIRVLPMLEAGTVVPMKQDEALATYAHKIEKADCSLDFSMDAQILLWKIRGLSPYPLSMTRTPDGKLLKIVSASLAEGTSQEPAGTVTDISDTGFCVACGDGKKILITGVLPEGKGRMAAADFVRGRRIQVGDRLAWTI
ncbi:MAG: methionyl-tRNA formyltransferase [Clostridiales bacterium]|jgi:methionyl-tRNA formyltransferase|nr:methionyl-tRNA formyltransferase [Clostridiales bacterium]